MEFELYLDRDSYTSVTISVVITSHRAVSALALSLKYCYNIVLSSDSCSYNLRALDSPLQFYHNNLRLVGGDNLRVEKGFSNTNLKCKTLPTFNIIFIETKHEV